MSSYYSKKKKLSDYLKFNESWFDLFISLGDHCWRQVIIRRRSSRVLMFSSMSVSWIFFIYSADHCWCQVIIRRRSSRAFI